MNFRHQASKVFSQLTNWKSLKELTYNFMLFSFYFIKNKYILDLGLLTKEKYKLNIYIHSIHINMTSYTHTSYTTLVMRKKFPIIIKANHITHKGLNILLWSLSPKKHRYYLSEEKHFKKRI